MTEDMMIRICPKCDTDMEGNILATLRVKDKRVIGYRCPKCGYVELWTPLDVPEKQVKIKGSKCPNCGATYVYPEYKIRPDGNVVCQNCGRLFPFAKSK